MLFPILAPAPPAAAQSPCRVLLREALQHYDGGEFDRVPVLLEPCLSGGTPSDERAAAYALIAKAYVVSDRLEPARQTIERLLETDPDFQAAPGDPSRFARLVAEVRRESAVVTVASVSKSDEPLREAPATVVVVTAEEIARRGYTDLEAVFHDLPGFDISRAVGQAYSNIYQRGLRSDFTNRTLFLVDGVEENEVLTGIVWLSRQFPVSTVERIEVIYGPASTMYGANAFGGVVNIVLKRPRDLLAESSSSNAERPFGGIVQAAGGSYSSRYLEASAAGQSGNLSWSVTGRSFRSDELDQSRYPEWDFDPGFFETVPYRDLVRIDGADEVAAFEDFLAENPQYDCRGQADCTFAISTAPGDEQVTLTEAGVRRAVELDQQAYLRPFQGSPVRFSNPTDDRLVHGRLMVSNLEIGFQTWQSNESQGATFTDRFSPGGDNGSRWFPKQTWIYVRYVQSLRTGLQLSFFSRFKRHQTDATTYLPSLVSYSSNQLGFNTLGLRDLAKGEPARWEGNYFTTDNTQLRNELSVVWEPPSRKLTLVSGIELRNSSIDSTWLQSPDGFPSVNATFGLDIPGGNEFDVHDLGFYAQATFRVSQDLKLIAGGRLDDNSSRKIVGLLDPDDPTVTGGGFGTVSNVRLAAVYSPGDFVFKAIYAEAFQAPSNFQKFTVADQVQELPAPDLAPEDVVNVDLAVSWQPFPDLSVELVGYESTYSNVVQLQLVPCDVPKLCSVENTFQNQSAGELRIRGIQAAASYTYGKLDFFGNYNYTDPRSTSNDLRIGDIASQRLNLGANAVLWDRFNVNLRLNYVGPRDRGPNTTVNGSVFTRIDDYIVLDLTLGYKNLFHGLDVALTVNNLLDEEYFHPGVRSADGTAFAARLPQRGRHFWVRATWRF